MNKIGFLIGIVLLGILVTIVIANQDKKNQIPQIAPSNPTITQSPTNSSAPDTLGAKLPASPSLSPISSPTAQQNNSTTAVIKTSKGDITLILYPRDAPNTVANFVKKAQEGFYNNLTIHRVEDWVIQGGDPLGTGTGGGKMPTELNNKPFVAGSLGVARGQDIKVSNDSQFFITKSDASWLNNQYTNFGIVTEGMEVVNKIEVGDKIVKIIVE